MHRILFRIDAPVLACIVGGGRRQAKEDSRGALEKDEEYNDLR